jgi:hypothetical protein
MMFNALFSNGDLDWMYPFFFEGNYPLALQLGIANGLCIIAIVLMRFSGKKRTANEVGFSRIFAWLVIAANFFLILNKDHRFIGVLA